MKNNKGFGLIAILIIVGILIIGGGTYYVVKNSKDPAQNLSVNNYQPVVQNNVTDNPAVNSNNTSQNPIAQTSNNNQTAEKLSVSTTSCSDKFIPPLSGVLDQQISITSDIFAISWVPKNSLGQYSAVASETYGIFKCNNGTWSQLYTPSDSSKLHYIALKLLPHQSILMINNLRGNNGDWGVVYLKGNSWVFTSGKTIVDKAVAQAIKNNLYFDFKSSTVDVVMDGNIIGQLIGYGCAQCKTEEVKSVTYSWDGSVLNVVSVKNLN